MTAPALVALAHGSRDPRSAATIKALVAEVRAMRPDLRVEAAFLELSKPSFETVVDRLVKAAFRDGLRAGVYSAVSADAVRPTFEERRANPRSRSAKLRWAKRGEG